MSIAVIGIPALSGLAGAATRLPLGNSFWHSCIQWYLGDATAALALTPTLLYWSQGGRYEVRAHIFRFALLIFLTAGLLYYTFFVPHSEFSPAVLYAPVPVLILAATTFRPVAVSSAISLLALVSIISTVQGRGPFHILHSHDAVLSMQLFLITVAGPMLFVAILIEERQTVANELRDKQDLLKERHSEIHDLAGRLLSAQEDERKRIARELHDDVSQRIAMLAIGLEELSESFPPGMDTERVLSQNLLNDAQDLGTDVHELSRQLHSSMLEHTGLEVSLRSLCRAASQKYRIMVELHSEGASGFSADINLCLFRVAQEAVNNAIKHGNARRIDVLLRKKKDRLCLRVQDNGKGFDMVGRTSGLGLVSMRERLRFLGGTLELKSEPGGGTELDAELPL
jgi:two-component system sensor histidine kinase UhpB